LFVAPRIAGGGRSWVAGEGVARMAEALRLEELTVERIGADLLVTGRPVPPAAERARPRAARPRARAAAR